MATCEDYAALRSAAEEEQVLFPGEPETLTTIAALDVIARVEALVGEYAEEVHSDECGFGPCVRCVVDEFAARLWAGGEER